MVKAGEGNHDGGTSRREGEGMDECWGRGARYGTRTHTQGDEWAEEKGGGQAINSQATDAGRGCDATAQHRMEGDATTMTMTMIMTMIMMMIMMVAARGRYRPDTGARGGGQHTTAPWATPASCT